MTDKSPRRWFRFSLRTLLVVVTVFCVWLGWELNTIRERKALLREMGSGYDFNYITARNYSLQYPPGATVPSAKRIPLVRRWLGDEAIQEIYYNSPSGAASDVRLKRLSAAFPEASILEVHPEPCHPGCFPAGTLVETPAGPAPIETLGAGDRVVALSSEGKPREARVETVFRTQNRLQKIVTSGGTLFTTPTQPLCLASGDTIAATKIRPGDRLLRFESGDVAIVDVTESLETERVAPVFNLILVDAERFVAAGFVARSKPPAVPID
jgi:hypothetical protein